MERILKLIGACLSGLGLLVFSIAFGLLVSDGDFERNVTSIMAALGLLTGFSGFCLHRFGGDLIRKWKTGRLFGRKPPNREEMIREEIRKRILKEAHLKDGVQRTEDEIQATLDALEEIVEMPREEMERIAENVRAEFGEQLETESKAPQPSPSSEGSVDGIVFPWTALFLLAITLYLIRRGSPWYLITGILLIVAIARLAVKYTSKSDDR
ncbi:MAG: hypothetical protein GY866_03070 [Proteobacteria bacterium]|nr:hypothetical protein [Pseudomonadota bacterium]